MTGFGKINIILPLPDKNKCLIYIIIRELYIKNGNINRNNS